MMQNPTLSISLHPPFSPFLIALLILVGSQLFCAPLPTPQTASTTVSKVGDQRPQTATTTVSVYEDVDRNGEQDADEPPIPDVLVSARFNRHGLGLSIVGLTDEEGRISITAEFTHYFDVDVVSPCGFSATTETSRSARDQPQLSFGFAPVNPQSGTTTVHIYLWNDENGNGRQDDGEAPLANEPLFVSPPPIGEIYTGDHTSLVTNSVGWASLERGNSCDILKVQEPDGWETASTNPASVHSYMIGNNNWLSFPYEFGAPRVRWGLRAR